jgi:hypothetical protein
LFVHEEAGPFESGVEYWQLQQVQVEGVELMAQGQAAAEILQPTEQTTLPAQMRQPQDLGRGQPQDQAQLEDQAQPNQAPQPLVQQLQG